MVSILILASKPWFLESSKVRQFYLYSKNTNFPTFPYIGLVLIYLVFQSHVSPFLHTGFLRERLQSKVLYFWKTIHILVVNFAFPITNVRLLKTKSAIAIASTLYFNSIFHLTAGQTLYQDLNWNFLTFGRRLVEVSFVILIRLSIVWNFQKQTNKIIRLLKLKFLRA